MDESAQPGFVGESVVTRHGRPDDPAKESKGAFSSAGPVALWALTLIVGLLALAGVTVFTIDRLQTDLLLSASDVEARRAITEVWPTDASGEYYEAVGELIETLDPENAEMAQLAAERAVAADPSRAFAWARIAYYKAEEAGAVGDEAIAALLQSMRRCGLCDPELVRWRFNFVLSNWDQMPEQVRRAAFMHADMLRWTGSNAEFLAEMKIKANAAGIPFDEYRSAVNTPVRSWDIEPVDD